MRNVNGLSGRIVFLLLSMLFASLSLHAQEAKNENGTINSKKYAGYSIVIDAVISRVESFWLMHLEESSSIRRKRDFYQVESFKFPDTYYPEAIFYSRIVEKDSVSKIWVALDAETLLGGEEAEGLVNDALKKYMSVLPVEFERNDIERKIAEAKRVVMMTEKDQQDLVVSTRNLNEDLTDAIAERERISKMLENLELEILAIKQRIENNKLDSTKSVEDLRRIQKVIEDYEKKLRDLQ